jgi:hypothetical protein
VTLEQAPDFGEEIANQPENATKVATGMPLPTNPAAETATWIMLPKDGTLWVSYTYGDQPAAAALIWHVGGQTEPLEQGVPQTFTVKLGDALMFELVDLTQRIKIVYAYI